MRVLLLVLIVATVFSFSVGHLKSATDQGPMSTLTPSPTPDFSGHWTDNGRAVTITQSGPSVTATYDADYECDPRDGGAVQKTRDDFQATLTLDRTPGQDTVYLLEGETTVCSYGKGNEGGTGLKKAKFNLALSRDLSSLFGDYVTSSNKSVHFSLERACSPDCRDSDWCVFTKCFHKADSERYTCEDEAYKYGDARIVNPKLKHCRDVFDAAMAQCRKGKDDCASDKKNPPSPIPQALSAPTHRPR